MRRAYAQLQKEAPSLISSRVFTESVVVGHGPQSMLGRVVGWSSVQLSCNKGFVLCGSQGMTNFHFEKAENRLIRQFIRLTNLTPKTLALHGDPAINRSKAGKAETAPCINHFHTITKIILSSSSDSVSFEL